MSQGTTTIVMPGPPERAEKRAPENPHEDVQTFARIYANERALTQLDRRRPVFPQGSVIVREKLASPSAIRAELLSIMIKRGKGFSRKTNDWEFFILDPSALTIRQQQQSGSCLTCHAEAKRTDFVFKTYLRDNISGASAK